MAGTVEGGRKAAAKTKVLHGQDFYARIGRKGGLRNKASGVVKGFATNRELASRVGRIGGTISRRGKARQKAGE